MRIAGLALAAVLVLAAVVSLQVIGRAQAQLMGPMPMQMPGGMMTGQQMDAMAAQMQAHKDESDPMIEMLKILHKVDLLPAAGSQLP